ncbi:BglG family transcription antiterminator [Clostridium weizhouense]|uniref:PRD domain-containing protein n=1 Tax=Clostridium weizhouense TaxID=2859781 RepID=A0ABS7AUN8_9CLOT|nr:PRD domain-containing protein [Clostridium weizhouense]MBW6411571.1 PRD domain-containing protein [Clostridium weizhouense]
MMVILNKNEVVSKVFNNNIVLVNSSGKEKILFAKGIGFGKKPGVIIPKGTEVDKVFTIENKQNIENLNNIVKKINDDFFAVCEEAIYEISKQLDDELNEHIHVGLIDHLYFSVERLKNKEVIENPFLVETETLYPKEFTLARIVAQRVGEYSKVKIPDGEVAFIALHIHSALNDGKISNTIKNTFLSSTIAEHVEYRLGIKIDKKSLDYARFCTHIKFAIQRIMDNSCVHNDLSKVIKNTYKDSYSIAEEVCEIIESELDVKVKSDEVAFLTIHIERFKGTTE